MTTLIEFLRKVENKDTEREEIHTDSRNIDSDREEGERREAEFCQLMNNLGCFTYRFQDIDKAAVLLGNNDRIILPDVWVIIEVAQQFFAEVKGKYPNRYNSYGIEEYRVLAYQRITKLTGLIILYFIFDTRDERWYYADFDKLYHHRKVYPCDSYVGGIMRRVNCYYFDKDLFKQFSSISDLQGSLFPQSKSLADWL